MDKFPLFLSSPRLWSPLWSHFPTSIRGSKTRPDLLLILGSTSRFSVSFPTSGSSTFRTLQCTSRRPRNSSILLSRFRSNPISPRISSGISETRAFGRQFGIQDHRARRDLLFLEQSEAEICRRPLRDTLKTGRPDALPRPNSGPSFRRGAKPEGVLRHVSGAEAAGFSGQRRRSRVNGVPRNAVQGSRSGCKRHPENGRSQGRTKRCKREQQEKRRGQNTELGGSDPTFRPSAAQSYP